MNETVRPRPIELRLREGNTQLSVTYDNGQRHHFTAEFLRVKSPSAAVKGHGPGQAVTVSGKRSVRILRLEPVGHYAVRIVFDDGHATGLYSWDYLTKLGREQKILWAAYLRQLEEKGLSRD